MSYPLIYLSLENGSLLNYGLLNYGLLNYGLLKDFGEVRICEKRPGSIWR